MKSLWINQEQITNISTSNNA